MSSKSNIIIVMTDQQRADLRKGCGYELDTMPFLDKWAEGGADFAQAYPLIHLYAGKSQYVYRTLQPVPSCKDEP